MESIDAHQVRAAMKSRHDKTNAGDAERLAEIARAGFRRPVAVKSADARGEENTIRGPARLPLTQS